MMPPMRVDRRRLVRLGADVGDWPAAGSPLPVLSLADGGALVADAVRDGPGMVVFALDGGWADVERLGARLSVAEAEAALPDDSTAIAALATTARAVLALAAPPSRRLPRVAAIGLALEAASTGIAGATARGLVLLAAAAMGVPAFEVHDDADPDAMARSSADGFDAALLPAPDPADRQGTTGRAIEKVSRTTAKSK
jgi:hypothetical protein